MVANTLLEKAKMLGWSDVRLTFVDIKVGNILIIANGV